MTRNNKNPRNTLADGYRIFANGSVGSRLRAIRHAHNAKYPDNFISQDTLAHAIGVKFAAINQAERGAVSTQIPILEGIAKFWDMTLDEMLKDIEEPTIDIILKRTRGANE